MKKVIVNGKEIVTNLGESGADTIVVGNDLPNRTMRLKESIFESNEEFVARLAKYGYTNIRLAKVTTGVRGCHDTIAYCR